MCLGNTEDQAAEVFIWQHGILDPVQQVTSCELVCKIQSRMHQRLADIRVSGLHTVNVSTLYYLVS